MRLTFIETLVFTARWKRRQSDEALRQLQNTLLRDVDAGDMIPGCGMLRKVRFSDERRGKGTRGGVRVIYVHTPEARRVDLITVYGKDEADDLSRQEVKQLCSLARLLREGAAKGIARSRG